jgi:hypothetical protein
MTRQTTNMANTAFRASRVLGVALALGFVATGCGAPDTSDGARGEESVTCPAKIAPWAVGTHYNVGDLVTFNGAVFQCRQAHTPVDGWFPNIVPALWNPVQCRGGNPAQQPPAQQPPAQQPPAQTPPPANNGQCSADGAPGPHFDPAGTKNVGNGHGGQFIGGQCLSAADCASGCCALPCGICSGPGAQFQAGKQGCGFETSSPPPAQQPPAQTPPPPPANNGQCQANGAPGPHFDPAGAKNVGNGQGGQFIGGQCLSHADCASGCCALPCGICSGPGAQFQAGKQGCGFGG